jgi:acyl-CoA dehydrogenase
MNDKSDLHDSLRKGVRDLCQRFPDSYWRELDVQRAYPTEFVRTLTEAGYLAALIPEEYGGAGLGVSEASIILEEINRAGCNSAACHAQMYTMGTLLRHGSPAQKEKYLPKIAKGELRLQAFGVSEPTTGSDTTQLKTMAVRKGDKYVVTGQKIWISRAEHSDLMLLIARTTPVEQIKKRSEGLSVLLVEMQSAIGNGLDCAHNAGRTNKEKERRPVRIAGRNAIRHWERPYYPSDSDHDEPRNHRTLHRWFGGTCRKSDWGGG